MAAAHGRRPRRVPGRARRRARRLAAATRARRVTLVAGAESLPAALLDAWGVTLADALDAACHNLYARSHPCFLTQAAGVLRAPFADGHAAARVLLPSLLGRLPLRGAPVAL